MQYTNPYRYKNGSYGIRRKTGDKRQVLVGKCEDEDLTYSIMLQATERLNDGETEASVKAWVQSLL